MGVGQFECEGVSQTSVEGEQSRNRNSGKLVGKLLSSTQCRREFAPVRHGVELFATPFRVRIHFLGRARRSRDGLMESCTCCRSGTPPHPLHTTTPPLGWPSRVTWLDHLTVGALGLYACWQFRVAVLLVTRQRIHQGTTPHLRYFDRNYWHFLCLFQCTQTAVYA